MSKLEVEFEFEIGDIVFSKAAQHCSGHRPKPFIIYERIAEQCHGGVQRLYKVMGFEGFVPEVVLSRDEPEYRPAPEAELKDAARIRAAERRTWRDEIEDHIAGCENDD